MPQRSSSPSLSRSVAMRAGASSGLPAGAAKKSRGCGSKVSTHDGTPRCRASLISSASIAWWPRCTPSKLPIVSAQAGADARGDGSRGRPACAAIIGAAAPSAPAVPACESPPGVEPAPIAQRQRPAPGRPAACRRRSAAVQRLDAVAHRGHHALDLVVLAFGQRQPQRALAGRPRRPRRAPASGRRRAPRRRSRRATWSSRRPGACGRAS